MSDNQMYWDSFYASRSSRAVPDEPSAFARWVEPRLERGQTLVEIGFGNGRDSFWLLRQGHPVLGYDFAESAVRQAQGHADARELKAFFQSLDLYDVDAVTSAADKILDATERPAIYGRFLIHSLEEAGRHHLFELAAKTLADGGDLYLEFRTGEDSTGQHLFGDDHFRVYLSPDLVASEIVERGGTVSHLEAGHGLAVYKTEDPHVARLVAHWDERRR
jgi:cyclopropane fatty-acyl-phospholipid synthase-like methyltransferase